MSADLDRMLTDGLRARAEAGSPVDPRPLLDHAVARGRKLRVRRRAVAVALAVAAVAGLTAATVLAPREHETTPVSPEPTASAYLSGDLARIPVAAGEPGATVQPGLVGSDPAVLHFSVDAVAAPARKVTWTSLPELETAVVNRADFDVAVALTPSRQKLAMPTPKFPGTRGIDWPDAVDTTVGGRPARVRASEGDAHPQRYSFLWQPVDGLWARAEIETKTRDQGRAVQILERVRFDEARRCAMPFRLGDLPAGVRLADCIIELTHMPPGPYMTWESTLTLADGDRRLSLYTRDDPLGPDPGVDPGRLRAGPYRVLAERDGYWAVQDEGVHIQAHVFPEDDPFTQAEVLEILAGLRVGGHPQDPRTW